MQLPLLLALAPLAAAQAPAYDFVIVGGGIGGLVMGARLSETSASVLVVEAGDYALDNANSTYVDGRGSMFGTALDWGYRSEPQRYSARGERQSLTSGRGVGGSTLINGLVYTRTEDNVLDAWAALGNAGWSWAAVLPYFKKSERLQPPGWRQLLGGATYARQNHGFKGPLHTGWSAVQQVNGYNRAAAAALRALGVPFSVDLAGGRMRAFNIFPKTLTTQGDIRADAGRAYYYPNQRRSNLALLANTLGTRITWAADAADGRAVASGVVVQFQNGSTAAVAARREVIVAAGAYRSPQLLELSGVGNPAILAKYGIATKVALPSVGEHLSDRMLGVINFAVQPNITFVGAASSVAYVNITDLFGSRTAAFAQQIQVQLPSYAAALAAQSNDATNAANVLRTLQVQYDLIFTKQSPVLELLQIPKQDANNVSFISCEMWGLFPFGRGNVHIRSADASTIPAINPNYWMFDFERLVQVAGARYIRRLYAQPAFAGMVGAETRPGLQMMPANATDDAWGTYLKTYYRTTYHPVGSNRMQPRDRDGVVDERCRVHGTQNVRVVDASVLPLQTTGHTSAMVYGVAERVADLTKADHGFAV